MSTIIVESEREEERALYLRTQIGTAVAEDGTELELDITMGMTLLILDVTQPDGTKRRETLTMEALLSAWAAALDEEERP